MNRGELYSRIATQLDVIGQNHSKSLSPSVEAKGIGYDLGLD